MAQSDIYTLPPLELTQLQPTTASAASLAASNVLQLFGPPISTPSPFFASSGSFMSAALAPASLPPAGGGLDDVSLEQLLQDTSYLDSMDPSFDLAALLGPAGNGTPSTHPFASSSAPLAASSSSSAAAAGLLAALTPALLSQASAFPFSSGATPSSSATATAATATEGGSLPTLMYTQDVSAALGHSRTAGAAFDPHAADGYLSSEPSPHNDSLHSYSSGGEDDGHASATHGLGGPHAPGALSSASSSSSSSMRLKSSPAALTHITEEERRMLAEEGVVIPPHTVTLTKTEERALKLVRRKLKNKISAQDSRRKKKEYVDGLESRVRECTAVNMEMASKVQTLKKENDSLRHQLLQLRHVVAKLAGAAATPATATGTVLMVIALSFSLFSNPGGLASTGASPSAMPFAAAAASTSPFSASSSSTSSSPLLASGMLAGAAPGARALKGVDDALLSATRTGGPGGGGSSGSSGMAGLQNVLASWLGLRRRGEEGEDAGANGDAPSLGGGARGSSSHIREVMMDEGEGDDEDEEEEEESQGDAENMESGAAGGRDSGRAGARRSGMGGRGGAGSGTASAEGLENVGGKEL